MMRSRSFPEFPKLYLSPRFWNQIPLYRMLECPPLNVQMKRTAATNLNRERVDEGRQDERQSTKVLRALKCSPRTHFPGKIQNTQILESSTSCTSIVHCVVVPIEIHAIVHCLVVSWSPVFICNSSTRVPSTTRIEAIFSPPVSSVGSFKEFKSEMC